MNKRKFSKKKEGISAIVATVLIILITVAIVALIWGTILPLVNQDLSFESSRVEIVTNKGFTAYDSEKDILSIQIKRGADEGNVSFIRLIIIIDGNSYSKIVDSPLPNSMRIYNYNLSNFPSSPEIVRVAPIYNRGFERKEGTITSEKKIPHQSLVSLPEDLEDFGCDTYETKCDDRLDNDCDNLIDLNDHNCQLTLDSDVVAYFNFNTDLSDLVGLSDGTAYGNAQLSSGLYGNGLLLDGNGDYVNSGKSLASLFDSSIFSVSLWFKKASSESDGLLISYSDSTGTNIDDMFQASIRDSRLNLTISEGTSRKSIGGTTLINNEWHHAVFVYSITQQNISMYLDGVLESASSSNVNIPNRNNLDLMFGCQKTSNSCTSDKDAFNGQIDEVAIFNDSLTPTEVLKLYNQLYVFDNGFKWRG